MKDEESAGQPSASTADDIEYHPVLIMNNRRVTKHIQIINVSTSEIFIKSVRDGSQQKFTEEKSMKESRSVETNWPVVLTKVIVI